MPWIPHFLRDQPGYDLEDGTLPIAKHEAVLLISLAFRSGVLTPGGRVLRFRKHIASVLASRSSSLTSEQFLQL